MTEDERSDEDLAGLSDEQQVALIQQTDNGLGPEDEGIEQPSQDPNAPVHTEGG